MRKYRSHNQEYKPKGLSFKLPSKTQQQFKDENNAYTVIQRHTKGLPINLNTQTPQYLDVSEFNKSTHYDKIQKLKKEIDEKSDKYKKLIKEENEKKANNQNPTEQDSKENNNWKTLHRLLN